MAGQPTPPQGPEDDFLDQFFSMAAGGSYSAAAAGGGRVAGDQPFSLALSLDAAAEASGSGKRLGGDAEGGKADRDAVQLPGLFPPVFGAGLQQPHLRPNPPPQVFHAQQQKQGGAGVGPQPPVPRPKVRARRGQATDPHSIAERLRRERIAERMRALQELVPNTNKTDRAAMLDEILDYVKFLRLQVKVLSMSRLGGAGAVAQLVSDIPLSVKDLPNDIRVAQEKKLEELKMQQELQNQLAVQRTIQLRDRKIKFFERRKIERMIRRLEKQQRSNADDVGNKLSKLREDLEYVRFFPKNEKYVSLFAGGNNPDVVEKRNKWRKQIKENLVAAAENEKDLETASDDDAMDVSDDDFFMSGSSSDEEADDEWTDKSAKEPASSASGKAASGQSSDEKNQRQRDARVLMPPPRSLAPNRARPIDKNVISSSGNTSNSTSGNSFENRRAPNHPGDHNSNLSSNSDARKPRRKRRPKKKKKLA